MGSYSDEPADHRAFTETFDRFYTRFAPAYDRLIKIFPVWKRWLGRALPHLVEDRWFKLDSRGVREVAFCLLPP